jgi:hypothetical protein
VEAQPLRRESVDGCDTKSSREFSELRKIGIRQGSASDAQDIIHVVAIRHGRPMPPDMTTDDDFDFEY